MKLTPSIDPGHEVPLALSPREAARTLGISARTLWEYTKRGTIPHVRLGRRVLYSTRELQQWLGQSTTARPPGS